VTHQRPAPGGATAGPEVKTNSIEAINAEPAPHRVRKPDGQIGLLLSLLNT